MKFKLVTQKKIERETEINSILIDTANGQIQVLPGHENLVSLLIPGVAEVETKDGKKERLAVNGGLLVVSNNFVTVITDEAASDLDLVESEIREAIKKAKDKTLPDGAFENEESRTKTLAYMMAKLKIARKRRGDLS